MKKLTTLFAATALATLMAGSAWSKTFVYCSEGSPEGFDPGLYTAGTTFDAAAHTVYNRLLEFKKGTTEVEPGLAESWTISDDGLVYTFKLRPGVKFQTTEFFTPTRELTADDVVFSYERQRRPTIRGTSTSPALRGNTQPAWASRKSSSRSKRLTT